MQGIQGSESAEDSPAGRRPSGGAAALDQEKLIIQVGSNGVDASYVMTTSVMKINLQYFSIEALAAIGRNEVQLLKNLSEVLDEDLTLNELIINVFDKERFH